MKKLALVLGGGGAWGISHIGVLKKLEELGIRPDIIVGSSIGSLIGGIYSTGIPLRYLEKISSSFDYRLLLDFNQKRSLGLLKGESSLNFLRMMTRNKSIEECEIPFFANAADFFTGEEVLIDSGNLAMAIRASTSIPWIFNPLEYKDRFLTDGGVADPFPVHIAKQMGAELIIGVGFGSADDEVPEFLQDDFRESEIPTEYFLSRIRRNDVLTKLFKSIGTDDKSLGELYYSISNLLNLIFMGSVKKSQSQVDVYIKPEVTQIVQLNFYQSKELIRLGYEEANKHEEKLKEVLKLKGV